MEQLKDLRVYNLANEISDKVWNLTAKWSYFEKDTIGKQLVRSAGSISANIAEGFGRYFYKENRKFCFYSRGSLLETINWIDKCQQRNLIESKQAHDLIQKLNELHKSLNAYIRSIGKQN